MDIYSAIVIGTGFSGLCQAIKLKESGIDNFKILEKADSVGGTWRENTYPGAECDIPSALYSYSFEPNPNWKHKWSHQDQILEYIDHCVDKYELRQHIEFNQKVSSLVYQDNGIWDITTETASFMAESVIMAIGQLHFPSIPTIKGQNNFEGHSWHSAKWNHIVDLKNKNVAVVGNAASAVQFIPEIAKDVKQLAVFQRSANWMLPKVEPPVSEFKNSLNEKWPVLMKLNRLILWLKGGIMYFLMSDNNFAKKLGQWYSLMHLKSQVSDSVLRNKLVPQYPIGAKRILFSDNYYPALTRENVKLITDPIDHINQEGVIDTTGHLHEADILIYATGFITNPFFRDIEIKGKGQLLSECWQDGAEAYLGMTVHRFPNFYMMYGPNTNLGHNSIIIMSEAQANYISQCINMKKRNNWKAIEVNKGVQESYNKEIQKRLKKSAWNLISKSWYRINDKITNNWPGRTMEYRRRTKRVKWNDYFTE